MPEIDILFLFYTYLAGVLIFLAPCTLPMIPAYLGFISGLTYEEMHHKEMGKTARRRVLINAFSFISGFSFVFVLFGLLAGVAGSVLSPLRDILVPLGGVIVLAFGLFLLGVFNLPILAKERRFTVPRFFALGSPVGSLLLGAAFAFGWTPCIGPVYGTVLFFAGSTETLHLGALLLFVFSAGFATPLLLLALMISQATRLVQKATPYLHAISMIGGGILVILGIHILLGDTFISSWFFKLLGYVNIEEALMPYL
jgi:cytochrome c-type biogenesis protein